MGSLLRRNCKYCKREFTEEEYAKKVQAKKDNAHRARAKALENGNKLGRKPIVGDDDIQWIKRLRLEGKSYRTISMVTAFSVSTVRKYLGEMK